PLTAYSTNNQSWMAWQFDQPDRSGGMIQAFRRDDCPFLSAQLLLQNLDPDARYVVNDYDEEQPVEKTGRELMEQGLVVTIAEKPGAALITYKKVTGR
ncbi:MAG: GH36 C-terminal domain-containing protein, partial [Pirellulales bacterium]|nr:GH36 C-terminal domain-containing protein [Pirellulales bacterium]